jgi:hypothetical protein
LTKGSVLGQKMVTVFSGFLREPVGHVVKGADKVSLD